MKKKCLLFLLYLSLSFIFCLSGCGTQKNIDKQTELHSEESSKEEQVEKEQKNEIYFSLEDIEKQLYYGNEIDCYKLSLDNGIVAKIPTYAINKEYELVDSFTNIQFNEDNDSFDKTYISTSFNDFAAITPSSYFILSRSMSIDGINEIAKENPSQAIDTIFQNSFLTQTYYTSCEQKEDVYIIVSEMKATPYSYDKESIYSGVVISYIKGNNIKFLFIGASDFSYKDNVDIPNCKYMAMSSTVQF